MFGSRSPIEWAGREREKEILELCRNHVDNVLRTVEGMRDTLHLFCDLEEERAERASEKVIEREREADKVKAEIVETLSKGTFHPINQEQIIRLVLTADDVAENARAAAVKTNLLNPRDLNNELRKNLKSLSDNLVEIAERVRSSFYNLQKNVKAAIDDANKVEKMEEELDSFRASELMPAVIEWSDQSGKSGTSIILKEVTGNMEEVADRSEDVADEIRSIAIRTL